MEINEAKQLVEDIVEVLQDIDTSDIPAHLKVEMFAKIANHAGQRASVYIAAQLSAGGDLVMGKRF